MAVATKSTIASFGGKLLKLTHQSESLGCEMPFNLYLPPKAASESSPQQVPLLIYLSGLTCTPDNCSEKGFFQHRASEKGIAILYPDTSPRGLSIEGEDESYDFGTGAGFYVDATAAPWSSNYRIYSYITTELPETVFGVFGDQIDKSRVSITGHSMGGHGALTLFLKNPGKYKSCSAFAPIANPLQSPWGQKAFKGYFGEDNWQEKGKEHDATELIKRYKRNDEDQKGHQGRLGILIDVGTSDPFYQQNQLLPENLVEAAEKSNLVVSTKSQSQSHFATSDLTIRFQKNYDHSYYTIATFAHDHVDHAAGYLA